MQPINFITKGKEEMKKYSKILFLLIAVVLLEIFVFNITSFRLLFGDFERIEYSKEDLEKYVVDDAAFRITDINKKVGTIKLEFGDDIDSFEYKWSYSDGTSDYLSELPRKNYIMGEERTKYMPVYLSGETKTLELAQNRYIYFDSDTIDKIVLNENIPIDFNFTRVGLILLIIFSIYAVKNFKIFNEIYDRKNGKQEFVLIILLAVAIIILAWINNNSSNAWESNFYGMDYVDAIVNNQLYLKQEPGEILEKLDDPYDPIEREEEGVIRGEDYIWDTAYYDGHQYVYFGILPLLLLFLPFHLITGSYLSMFVAVFIFSIIVFIMLKEIICKIYAIFFKEVPFKIVFYSNIILYSGSFMWYANGMGRVYEVAIISGLAFVLMGINFIINSIIDEKGRYRNIFFGSLCLALSVACRPIDLLASLLIVPYLLSLLIENIKNFKNDKKSLFRLIISVAIPYLAVGAALMWFNYVRFGNVFDFGSKYQMTITNVNKLGSRFSAGIHGFVINLFSIPSVVLEFPFLTHHNNLFIYYGNYYIENMIGGIFVLVPICLINFFIFKSFKNYKDLKLKIIISSLVIVGTLVAFLSAVMAGSTQRYVIDYTWMYMISGLLIYTICFNKLKTDEGKRIFLKILAVIAIFTLIVGIVSGIITEHDYFSIFAPDEFNKLKYMICFWE